MQILQQFADRLKGIRTEMGKSQDEMAKALDVNRMSYSYYENAKRTPDIEFLARLSALTGYSADYLLGKDACTAPDVEAISNRLGLSEAAINALSEPRVGFGSTMARRTINDLVSTCEGRDLLASLGIFLYGDFSKAYTMTKSHIVKKVDEALVIQVFPANRKFQNPGNYIYFPPETMRESALGDITRQVRKLQETIEAGGAENAQQEK